jgi:2-methylisocitrate lyase-like PEP mutase family enzyme
MREADESLDVEAVKALLARYDLAGLAAMQLDDSISGQCSKKNRKGNAIEEDTFLERLQAAADERLRISSNIVIIARTNILLSCTCHFCWEQALTRLERAIRKGADVVFMAGRIVLSDIEYLARKAFQDVPLMSTPQQAATRKVKSLGVKIISYPELFTSAIYDGATYLVQDFGEVRPVPGKTHLDDTTKLGGLRALCKF